MESAIAPTFKLPNLSLRYLEKLTDDFSIWQHSNANEVHAEHGYALDDAARALLVALSYDRLDLARVYLAFLKHACCDYEHPVNFFDEHRKPTERGWSEDALAQTWWASSLSASFGLDTGAIEAIKQRILPYIERSVFLRTHCYLALAPDQIERKLQFIEYVLDQYSEHSESNWGWPEDSLRYGNAIIPYALLEASDYTHNLKAQQKGIEMLDFLNATCTVNDLPIAIGNKGWYVKNGEKNLYDQQPIDPAYQVLANCSAFRLTNDAAYLQEAEKFLSWFWGNNLVGLPLIDLSDESCRDGFDETEVSANKGAENIICYLLAQAAYRSVQEKSM